MDVSPLAEELPTEATPEEPGRTGDQLLCLMEVQSLTGDFINFAKIGRHFRRLTTHIQLKVVAMLVEIRRGLGFGRSTRVKLHFCVEEYTTWHYEQRWLGAVQSPTNTSHFF